MKNLVELYCDVDDFCRVFIPQWKNQLLEDGTRKRRRDSRMSTGEIMTIIIGFHMSHHHWFPHESSSGFQELLPRLCVSIL